MKTGNFDIVGSRKLWYIVSTILILPGILSLFVWHLNVGIDFKGGSLLQVTYQTARPDIEKIRTDIANAGATGATVQTTGDQGIIIRYPNQDNVEPALEKDKLLGALKLDGTLDASKTSFENIGGSVAKATTSNAVKAVIITSIAIILFIAWSFNSVPKPASSWRFGVTAILALAHDILFVVGAFSIIGHFFPDIEVDALFITALLTILGFSVNDTIVVFDRIRENLRRLPGKSFDYIANASLNQTLARSINTSMTVLIVLTSLLLLGGGSIRNFILALTLGVAIGTYSSIFNASPLLVTWQNAIDKKATK
jgi:preprotein translocase subunit SecF